MSNVERGGEVWMSNVERGRGEVWRSNVERGREVWRGPVLPMMLLES